MKNEVIDRVLAEVRNAEKDCTTSHQTYTSGIFEDSSPIIERVLEEVRNAQKDCATSHSTYTSGIFEN